MWKLRHNPSLFSRKCPNSLFGYSRPFQPHVLLTLLSPAFLPSFLKAQSMLTPLGSFPWPQSSPFPGAPPPKAGSWALPLCPHRFPSWFSSCGTAAVHFVSAASERMQVLWGGEGVLAFLFNPSIQSSGGHIISAQYMNPCFNRFSLEERLLLWEVV